MKLFSMFDPNQDKTLRRLHLVALNKKRRGWTKAINGGIPKHLPHQPDPDEPPKDAA